MKMPNPSRRTVLAAVPPLVLSAIAAPAVLGRAFAASAWSANPFSLGVASGAPSSDGFVLWTRLAPEPLAEDQETLTGAGGSITDDTLPITVEIAGDDAMSNIVQRTTANAERTYAYSVHHLVRGLEPGRPYWYRFVSGDAASAIGCARTLPAASSRPDRLRFAYFSCSNYELGYFSAYRHAAEEMPDFSVFLGDYIYEYVNTSAPTVRRHSGGAEAATLAQYRARYAQYHLDPDLQRLHAACPSLATWDDHEVQNDYADKWSETFDDPDAFLKRRAAAYRAFYENMPMHPERSRPMGPAMRVYDRYGFGDLAEINLLDGRQYRSREACYGRPDKGHGHLENDTRCPERADAGRSMIGMAQEAWLFDGFANSKARWNIIAQDVLMAAFREKFPNGDSGFWTDDWNGYPASRARLLQHLHDSKTSNPVVLSGDIHSFWANDLKLDFDDANSPAVAAEFIGTSVSSAGPNYQTFKALLPDNPHVKFFESRKRGYVSAEIARNRLDVRFRALSDVTDPMASIATLAGFAVEDGRPGVQIA